MKKLFCFDFDGTLFDHKKREIPKSAYQALNTLKAQGHLLAIATGRPPVLLNDLPFDFAFDGMIHTNGRLIIKNQNILAAWYIPTEQIISLINDVTFLGIDIGFQSQFDYVLFSSNHQNVSKFNAHWHIKTPDVDTTYHLNHPILQLVIYSRLEHISKIISKYPDLDFFESCPYGIDVHVKGKDKGHGVEILRKHLKIPHKDVIVFGDSFNDYEMIQHAHQSVAMGDAPERIKACATYVTKSAYEDGIYYALKSLKYI